MRDILFFLFVVLRLNVNAQDQNAFVPNDDAKDFNFWAGNWYLVKDDNTIDTTIYFKVRRSVHHAAFEEEWNGSFAIRAWDKTNNKWGFTWISANGLFQNWDSKKVGSDWFIYKEFTVNGDTYLSRQCFILQSNGDVIRKSEKSYDAKTWEHRFTQRLRKHGLK